MYTQFIPNVYIKKTVRQEEEEEMETKKGNTL